MRSCRNYSRITENNIYGKLRDLTDCAGLSEKGDCTWLNTSCCRGGSCSFRQTKEETQLSKHRWKLRLSSLDSFEQKRIAEKYHNGAKPWRE